MQYCHENVCHFVLPSRITVKLVHLVPDTCRCIHCCRYTSTCQCTGFAGARAASPPTQPRRIRSLIFVYDLVCYSSHACAHHNSRGCVAVAFVPPCTRLHTYLPSRSCTDLTINHLSGPTKTRALQSCPLFHLSQSPHAHRRDPHKPCTTVMLTSDHHARP